MSTTNVRTQLNKAKEMRESVIKFADSLDFFVRTLNEDLDFYVRAGFPEDVAESYKAKYLQPASMNLEGIANFMRKEHAQYLTVVIDELEGVKGRTE